MSGAGGAALTKVQRKTPCRTRMAEGFGFAVAEDSPLGESLSVLLNRSPLLVTVVPETFDFEKAVIAEGTPATEVEVEEGSVVFIVQVAVALCQRCDNPVRGSGDCGTDSPVSLDELDADNTLVHLVPCDVSKKGVL